MRIGISADSVCDIPKELLEKYDIHLMPIAIMLGEEVRHDSIDVTTKELFDYVKESGELPKTSASNVFEYVEHFNKIRETYDAVIHFSLSFGISSTGNNALNASKECDNVYVIDSKSLSSGVGLLILSCVDKINEGKDVITIVNEINEEVNKVQASFLIDTLKYLHKGGRCSSLAVLGANLLKIKPRICLVDGKMQVTKKYIGRIEEALKKYAVEMLTEVEPNKKRVFITYSSPVDCIDYLKEMLKNYGFEEIIECSACATISAHCGPKTLGILYIGK